MKIQWKRDFVFFVLLAVIFGTVVVAKLYINWG